MALKTLPPDTADYARSRALAVHTLRPLADRISARELTVISIGGRCVTAGLLNIFGLRRAAYPFDWLFSSLPMVEHCLRTDFAEFLNPRHFDPVPIEIRGKPTVNRTHHRLYREEFGVEHVFNHHDMPEMLSHFERAVERFRRAAAPHLLHVARQPAAKILPEVEAVADAANGRVLAISVVTDPAVAAPHVRPFATGERYDLFEMTAAAPVHALSFGSARDEMVFSKFLAAHFG